MVKGFHNTEAVLTLHNHLPLSCIRGCRAVRVNNTRAQVGLQYTDASLRGMRLAFDHICTALVAPTYLDNVLFAKIPDKYKLGSLINEAEIFRVGRECVPPCLDTSDLSIGFMARLVDHKCLCKAVEGTLLDQ